MAFNSRLHFQNDTYIIDVVENTSPGKEIVQVKAIPPTGTQSMIAYSIKSGNEESAVDIDSRTGMSNSLNLLTLRRDLLN